MPFVEKALEIFTAVRRSNDPAVAFSLNVFKLCIVAAAVVIGFSLVGYAIQAALYIIGVVAVSFIGYKAASSIGLVGRGRSDVRSLTRRDSED